MMRGQAPSRHRGPVCALLLELLLLLQRLVLRLGADLEMPAEAADALGASALERVAQLLQHGVELHVGSGHVIRRSHWRGRRRATG